MTNIKLSALICTAAVTTCLASQAFGDSDGFWSTHNVGVTYEASTSRAEISYRTDATKDLPEDCQETGDKSQMLCTANLAPDSDTTPTPSLFLQAPFKRQGLLFFDLGLTFATVTYKGGIVPKASGKPTLKDSRPSKNSANSQPLQLAYLELYGINWQAYTRVGITPSYIPDLFLTVGAGLQTVAGRVKIYKEDKIRSVIQPDVFAELELVVFRFNTGSLSAFYGTDQSLIGTAGSKLINDNPSGENLTDFHLGLFSAASGIRLLFPF